MSSAVLACLRIDPLLKERIVGTAKPGERQDCGGSAADKSLLSSKASFVLYLPTVLLRYEHNPAFAVACHIANSRSVPVVVLATVLDDASLPENRKLSDGGAAPIVMTSRRLAFQLEALSQCAREWSEHGAGVAVRVHGPGCRIPDHLTLSGRAVAVVTDEPFVHPYLTYVRRVEKACRAAEVPCFRVDGSTTVPPCGVLKRVGREYVDLGNDSPCYSGVSAKAWMWQKKTESRRMGHVRAAMNGAFDAPALSIRINSDSFFSEGNGSLSNIFPKNWRDAALPAPGRRPWSVSELRSLTNVKDWAMNWPGADNTVPVCTQTVGTTSAGYRRWNYWVRARNGLVEYARRRNDPRQPHASSRMSCYLNLGIVSIFRLVYEVKAAQLNGIAGADKFEGEIVKWREQSYAHAQGNAGGDLPSAVPSWAAKYLDKCGASPDGYSPSLGQLQTGTTSSDTWNAMQRYLVNTGELHNNARMTWGKTVVHWGKTHWHDGSAGAAAARILRTLCYLNDRFALDGLSPPSYAGLLWCMGWSDKPTSWKGISEKGAHQYRIGPGGFQQAEINLLAAEMKARRSIGCGQQSALDMVAIGQGASKRIKTGDEGEADVESTCSLRSSGTLHTWLSSSDCSSQSKKQFS
uniref:Photolyase/cryptochrome alpha/beta domain-containing protein n=1 Tax=Odontella aurita TaxID=265563 RepID=A0A7S4MBH8_9STRA|mmetsp:Transcript_16502/g.47473  ORF Transcript_16502/g.47473 Transcript_16502/m.47473 type:complete len:634 (+) Transcript_16502:387-2288(+)